MTAIQSAQIVERYYLMNENVLMENPLDIFSDFEQIPDEAFQYDKDEIYGLVRTITNSDDFLLFLSDTLTNQPERIEAEVAAMKVMLQDAYAGKYSPSKNEAIIYFVGDVLKSIEDITAIGGTFKKINVSVFKCRPDAILPKYATTGDAGMDLYSAEEVTLEPHMTKIVPTGLKLAIPGGYYLAIVPRSGLSLKTPLRVGNAPGTIDSGYRGELGIIMTNTGDIPFTVPKGERIAQAILHKIPHIVWNEVTEEEWNKIADTDRGEGGYGSTGQQ